MKKIAKGIHSTNRAPHKVEAGENGTRDLRALDQTLHRNQRDIVDEIITPHVRLPETLGAKHRIVSAMPAHAPDAQGVQARGRIVWSKAYSFQPHGPSFLDPIPDPGLGGGR